MKLFVWDLHGTLEQGNEQAVIELSNMALAQLGYVQRFRLEDSRDLYGLKWFEYYERLLPDETNEQHMALQTLSFALSDAHPELIARSMRPADHAIEVLRAIHQSDHQQILISNTVPTAVPLFLSALGMQPYFSPSSAFSVNAHHKYAQRTKGDVLHEYLRGKQFESVVVIGDSATDIKLARAIGATSYLYAHPGYTFRTEGGDYRISDLRTVLQELNPSHNG